MSEPNPDAEGEPPAEDEREGPAYVSPTSLAAYLYCPRKYDFDKVQDVATPDRTERYLQQGLALHRTIEETSRAVDRDADAEAVHEVALGRFAEVWPEEVDEAEFESAAQHEYLRRTARAGLEQFFDPEEGPGIDHARRSIAAEIKLTTEHEGVPLLGYADNVLRTDHGLHVIDYKRNIHGMLTSGTADRLADHLAADEHEPRRVKNAIQTAVYVEGVKDTDLYEPGMTVEFSFYGLLNVTDFEPHPAGYTVSARGYPREMTEIYDEHHDTIWELITSAYEGIKAAEYEPEPWDLIREEGCGDCEFRAMCPDYLAGEVEL